MAPIASRAVQDAAARGDIGQQLAPHGSVPVVRDYLDQSAAVVDA